MIKRIKLFFGKNDYCPKCLEIFDENIQIKFNAGYNVTCNNCDTYIYHEVIA